MTAKGGCMMVNHDYEQKGQLHNEQYSSKKIVTIVAYLVGVKMEILTRQYDKEVLGNIKDMLEVKIVRSLSKIRQGLLDNYTAAVYEICHNLKNIDTVDFIDAEDVTFLSQNNVPVMMCNCTVDEYVAHITELIGKHINKCKALFPKCVEFSYIRSAFCFPCSLDERGIRKEFAKYWKNKRLYPFGLYIYWNPQEYGNLLYNDEKFLAEIYRQHKRTFKETYLFRDVSYGVKNIIHNYVEAGSKVIFAVDCENVDPYKFFSMVDGLSKNTRDKIYQIVLYNDVNANKAWDYIDRCLTVPIKCVQTQRVLDRKSVVDMTLIAEVMKMHYEQKVDKVVLCSSDSDFLPLISALSDVQFMVLYEHEKCSHITKQQWKSANLLHYSLDDFYLAQSEKLQECVLVETLIRLMPTYIGKNITDLASQVFSQAMIKTSENQDKLFCEKCIKQGKFYVDTQGVLNFSL